MNNLNTPNSLPMWLFWLFIVLTIVSVALKGVGLWKSAGRKQKWWFIAMLIVNSVGLLPIIYLVFFNKEKKQAKE